MIQEVMKVGGVGCGGSSWYSTPWLTGLEGGERGRGMTG